jgi:RNA polymerase sigma factor (sigma-70 family)
MASSLSAPKPISELPLPELIRLLLAQPAGGGSEQCEEIIRRFAPLLRSEARRLPAEVEYADFVQEVFVRLFRSIRTLEKDPYGFPGYFQNTVRWVASDLRRKVARNREDPMEEERLAELSNDFEIALVVRSYLELLPKGDRELLQLLYIHQLTPEEVASRSGMSRNAVALRKSRALKRLRQILHLQEGLVRGKRGS